jgi:hypothetical protein
MILKLVLFWERSCDVGVVNELRYAFSFMLVVLESLTDKRKGFNCEERNDAVFEAVVTPLNLGLEVFSLSGVEGG